MQRQFDESASRRKASRAQPHSGVARLSLLFSLILAAEFPSSAHAEEERLQRRGSIAAVELALSGSVDGAIPVEAIAATPLLDAEEMADSAKGDQTSLTIGALLSIAGATGGGVLLIAALLVERSRRLAVGRQLQASDEQMALAASAADLGFWHWQAGDDQLSADENCRRLLGFAPGTTVRLRTLFKAIHPEDRAGAWREIEAAIRAGSTYRIKYRAVGTEGSIRWILASGSGKRDEKGNPSKLTGMVVDITARQQAEADATAQRDELAHLSRVAILGELSGALAHELNQPLTAILSNAQAALRLMENDNIDLVEIREILGDIVEDDGRAVEVIRRMRALLRKDATDRRAIDPNHLLKDVATLMRNELSQRQVRLVLQLGPNPPTVIGDSVQLQQVLINFILNGCEAMQHKLPRDRILTLASDVDKKGGLVVSVTDQGAGIIPEARVRLFEPFFTTKPAGLGLGLSISRSILMAHGGRIWAENNARGGATFSFALPAETGKSRVVAA